MTEIQKQAQAVVESLTESVREALDKKRRLGQYAIIWKDGKATRLFDNQENGDTKIET